MNIQAFINEKIREAIIKIGIYNCSELNVRQSIRANFGDYQVNGIIGLAKTLHAHPQYLAEKILHNLHLNDIAKKVVISNPGYINIYLDCSWLANQIEKKLISPNLGIKTLNPQRVVIDYSSPNVAKEMHVGHLRSTIIGDATARTLEFLGHHVIRANHIGDWGMQFGMLIALMEIKNHNFNKNLVLSDLENLYREAKNYCEIDTKFAQNASNYVLKLQQGDLKCLKLWKFLVDISIKKNQTIYNRLNVTLTNNDIMGESFYNQMLPDIVNDLKSKGLAVENEGAIVVFLDEFKNKKGNPMGVIIQKKDGAYLYTTTDIACIKYRYEKFKPDRIIYYIDSRQYQHLKQVWTIVRKAGYIPKSVSLEHHMFGMMLDKNDKPFKTRTGETVKLLDLLDEAVYRAKNLISSKNPNFSSEELTKVANIVGIGAIKYADLSKNRLTNYVFDWDQMLSFDGNTAPYIQYAYTRAVSIFKKAKEESFNYSSKINEKIVISNELERLLAVRLVQFEETIIRVAINGTPHIMCAYLYNLASLFSNFYEKNPIIKISDSIIRKTRLKLVKLFINTINSGLNTLGIQTIDRM
ncbi:MAG: arginine--tRNA ligase [Candidatus Dasytiphilus stammeri]